MAERIRLSHEQDSPSPGSHEHYRGAEQHEAAQPNPAETAKKLEDLKSKVEKLADPSEQTKHKHEQHVHQAPKRHVLRNEAPTVHTEKQAIKRVQKQLKGPERQFSKVIHNPIVETASDVTGATIARSSGLLVGGAFSLIASIVVLILVKYYGYEYNFFVAIGAFVGGYILGVILEFLYRAFKPASKKS